jgi:hypothetical protein
MLRTGVQEQSLQLEISIFQVKDMLSIKVHLQGIPNLLSMLTANFKVKVSEYINFSSWESEEEPIHVGMIEL